MAGIYIHIPFCKQACYYCNFHFAVSRKRLDELCECIGDELRMRCDELNGQKIHTIYFGGGTPSILEISVLEGILNTIYENYDVDKQAEVTLEANPDDLSLDKLQSLRSAGINRLSIGVQSFRDEDLRFMNRAHSSKEALSSVKNAQKYFDNITVDLIYSIPGLTNEAWMANIMQLIALEVPHVSAYALTVEEKTALHHFVMKGKVAPVNEENAQVHFNILTGLMSQNSYAHYEISNFSRPGFISRHNASYWKGEPYLGVGPSAHSYNGNQRSWNIANNSKYMKSIAAGTLPVEIETLTLDDRYNEYLMTGLRVEWGVDLVRIRTDFGESYEKYLLKNAKKHISNKFLCLTGVNNQILKTTQKGKFLADGLASDLFVV